MSDNREKGLSKATYMDKMYLQDNDLEDYFQRQEDLKIP